IVASQAGSTWDFAKWQPHAVVINLGTNDASTSGDPGTPYETAYLGFVRTLRQKYPDAHFVLTIGPTPDAPTLPRSRDIYRKWSRPAPAKATRRCRSSNSRC